jgi:hypothetical protein
VLRRGRGARVAPGHRHAEAGRPAGTQGGLLFQPVGGSAGYTCNASLAADGTFVARTEQVTGKETLIRDGIPKGEYAVTYHPPGDGQRSDLAVTLPETVVVPAGGLTVGLKLPDAPAAAEPAGPR